VEIEKRPTSTGPPSACGGSPLPKRKAPADLEDARKRLLKTNADLWTEKDRQAVGAMLQRRIEEERLKAEESGGSSLREQLAAALDYRQWHRFVVERNAMGKWISISQPASSGERALGLTIPMFAAVASFYGNEHSTRPRLVFWTKHTPASTTASGRTAWALSTSSISISSSRASANGLATRRCQASRSANFRDTTNLTPSTSPAGSGTEGRVQ
jgi:hypothetical protein